MTKANNLQCDLDLNLITRLIIKYENKCP